MNSSNSSSVSGARGRRPTGSQRWWRAREGSEHQVGVVSRRDDGEPQQDRQALGHGQRLVQREGAQFRGLLGLWRRRPHLEAGARIKAVTRQRSCHRCKNGDSASDHQKKAPSLLRSSGRQKSGQRRRPLELRGCP